MISPFFTFCSQKFKVTFITKMCLSPAHFHQFLHPSIETHYEGPAKYGMIVEIKGHPKPVLMPNCLGIVNNVPQTITIFVGVHCTPIKFFSWAYIVCPQKIVGIFLWAYMYAHVRPWAYNYVGVQCMPIYAHGRTGCNLWG